MPAAPRGERVLWLSHETPDRFGQGGQRRQYFQIKALAERGHQVHVVSLLSPQSDASLRRIATVERPRTHVRGRRLPWTRGLVRRRAESGRWDRIVLAHGESLSMIADGWDRPPLLVDLHNVYSVWNARLGWAEMARAERAVEERALRLADTVSVCSTAERDRLLSDATSDTPVIVCPHGVDADEWPPQRWDRSRPVVAAFGSWSWLPNERGLQWFLAEVWPAVRRAVPDAEFRIAGKELDWLVPTAGVTFLGRVPDLGTMLADATVVVSPVFDGAGASMKYAESLACGAHVAATCDAATAAPGSPGLVSDQPGEWIAQLIDWLCRRTAEVPAPERDHALHRLTWSRTTAPLDRWLRDPAAAREPVLR